MQERGFDSSLACYLLKVDVHLFSHGTNAIVKTVIAVRKTTNSKSLEGSSITIQRYKCLLKRGGIALAEIATYCHGTFRDRITLGDNGKITCLEFSFLQEFTIVIARNSTGIRFSAQDSQ